MPPIALRSYDTRDLPLESNGSTAWGTPVERSLETLSKRGTVQAITSCRPATTADFSGLNDAQMQVLIANANTLFNKPVTTYAGPRSYRSDMFRGTNYGGWNARISTLRTVDIVQNGQNAASTCVDGTQATYNVQEDTTTCSDNNINVYGTSNSQGSTIAVLVQQGFSVGGSITTETSTGTNWATSSETGQTNTHNSVSISTNELGGESATEIGFSLFGAEAKETITIAYNHVWEDDTENGSETSTTNGNENGGDSSRTLGTESMNQIDFTNSVTVTIAPPAGYTCYVSVGIASCRGTVSVVSPITFPSGMMLVDFGPDGACVASDTTCAQPTQYFYVPINTLLQGMTPPTVTDNLAYSIKAAGRYVEHCDAPNTIGNGGNGTAGSGTVAYDTTYTPTLNCPKNLGVKSGCSVMMDDYLGQGIVTGDTGIWSQKLVTYTQSPGPATNVNYGQQYITFNASTPYHATSCQGLLQVVPPFSSTFLPGQDQIAFPQSGADVVGATYTVGYVGSCDDSQYGMCTIKNVTALNTPNFTFKRTSAQGNPIQTFTFGNGGGGWPEYDQLTFNIQCTDLYGNVGGVQTYQKAFRNDVATQTLTAKLATFTFQSATKYLYTSTATLYTSVVTPVTTVDLHTQTVYTGTSYTGTKTITQYGAKSNSGTTTITSTKTRIPTTITKTTSTTVTPTPPTTTLTVTKSPSQTVTVSTTLAKKTSTVLLTPTVTKTETAKFCGTVVPKNKRSVAPRAIHSTTTVTDNDHTYTVTDYTNTATYTNQGTTTMTDYTNWATTTLAKTSTVYDPFDTQYVTGVLLAQSTKVIDNFTNYLTRTRTRTTTSTSTTTRSLTSSIPQKTVTTTLLTGAAPTSIVTVTPIAATTSVNATTITKTVTSTATVTCTL